MQGSSPEEKISVYSRLIDMLEYKMQAKNHSQITFQQTEKHKITLYRESIAILVLDG